MLTLHYGRERPARRYYRHRLYARSEARSGMDPRHPEDAISSIVSGYPNLVIRLYSRVRFVILRQTLLEEIGQYLPERGDILDIGCGFGLFSLYFAAVAPGRRMVGVDWNARRIDYARANARELGLENVEYDTGDAIDWQSDATFDAIYLLDLVHHLPKKEVPGFLRGVRHRLRPGGTLVVKHVEDRPRWKMYFTLILDRLMVGREPIAYWSAAEFSELLEGLGFEVRRHRIKDFLPYPHILYACRLP